MSSVPPDAIASATACSCMSRSSGWIAARKAQALLGRPALEGGHEGLQPADRALGYAHAAAACAGGNGGRLVMVSSASNAKIPRRVTPNLAFGSNAPHT